MTGPTPPEGGELSLPPGRRVGKRYRIQRLLGTGSMGEVYSAADRTLGRPVALKFLPAGRQGTAWRLQFANEVALGRRVSHPNVCRIHEIGSFDDRVFLSMELIPGETLEEVLSRSLGQLSREEKLRIAHDLCAGLGAIHGEGIIHCDLKPANVMLEPGGRAIITDFGLATAGGLKGPRRSGTPAYMAPEQGEMGPSFSSDLYALGLVLYELFAGGMCWDPSKPPALPAGTEVDSKVREAILRCLQQVPEDRPGTTEEVADLLPPRPGHDPAREDRVVPPETLLVSPRYRPRPWVARALFGAAVAALALVPLLGSRTQIAAPEDLPDPPAVLISRARQHLAALGFREPARDRLYGFTFRPEQRQPGSAGSESGSGPPALLFWYRESPKLLAPIRAGSAFRLYEDPPMSAAGSVGLHLDERGRLWSLDAVPETGGGYGPWPEPDWRQLFAAAGLEPAAFEEAAPQWTPPVFADLRKAWSQGGAAEQAGLRVEAAAYQGRLVGLRVLDEGDAAGGAAGRARPDDGRGPSRWITSLWFFTVLGVALFLAPRNLLQGRADRRAAFRLALAVLVGRSLVGVLGAEHLRGLGEVAVIQAHLARAIHAAALVWILYVALEPYARRWWPDQTASWVRLLYGRWRDPLVGRDLLVGTLFGLGAMVCSRLYLAFAGLLGSSLPRPGLTGSLAWQVGFHGYLPHLEALRGLRQTFGISLFALVHGTLVAFFAVVGVVLLRRWLRHPLLSRGVALALFTAILFPMTGATALDLAAAVTAAAVWLAMLVRFGFLTAVTGTAVAWWLNSVPFTLDPASWFAPGSTVALLAVLALAGFGFFVCLEREKALPPWVLNLRDDPPPAPGPRIEG